MNPDGPARRAFRLGDRAVLVLTLGYVVAVVLTPVGLWKPLAVEGLVLAFFVGLSGIEPSVLLKRWLGFAVLFGFLALMVARAHPDRAQYGWGVVLLSILAKNTMALVAVITMTHAVPLPRVVGAARRLGFPEILASSLLVMERYQHVLADERDRMIRARRARTFRRSGRLDWLRLSGLIGLLFVRSFERGERVHAAMLARGWDGSWRSLDGMESEMVEGKAQ
jgi:cobalt/nickel transport system permease protein